MTPGGYRGAGPAQLDEVPAGVDLEREDLGLLNEAVWYQALLRTAWLARGRCRALHLPVHPGLTRQQVESMTERIHAIAASLGGTR
jgi:hypothetical protein